MSENEAKKFVSLNLICFALKKKLFTDSLPSDYSSLLKLALWTSNKEMIEIFVDAEVKHLRESNDK